MSTKASILIVDDDPHFTKTLADILSLHGYAPLAAAKGKTALNRVKKERPAVALIDLKLPDMDGLEVMEEIKKRSPATECIVLTGYADLESATEAVNLGAYGYMQKPYDVEQLVLTIRRAVEKREAEEALRESEEKYRTILENIEDGYFEVDIAGNFTFFNDSLCRIIGYPRDEMMGMNNRDYMDKENAKKVFQAFNRVYTTGKPTKGFGWEIIRKDGTRRFVEASASLIRDPEGEPIGFRGIVRDITERKRAEEALRNAALETLEALSQLVEAKDPYTAGHSAGATELAIKIAKEMGLADGEIDTLRIAGPIHDVGKVGIAGSVLNKPARLTQAEWVMIQAHPVVSAQTAERVAAFKDAVPVIRHHHERWDGTGYPDGLEGEDIPLLARILAVADGFEAMTSERPYRRARTEEEALAELEKGAGTQWDPEVVKVFLRFRKPPPKRKSKRKRRK